MSSWITVVRFAFHLLYYQLAWTYDAVSWVVSLGEWRKWQFATLDFIDGEAVLEIAHGTGHLLAALAARGYAVSGLDLSPNMGRIAQRRLARLGRKADLVRGRAQQLPFRTDQFDTVVVTFPTPFIFEAATLAAIGRVLQPNGRLVFVLSGGLHGNGLLKTIIDWLYRITGQSESEIVAEQMSQLQTQFADQNWQLEIERISFERSYTAVLIATQL